MELRPCVSSLQADVDDVSEGPQRTSWFPPPPPRPRLAGELDSPCSDLCAAGGDSNASCIPETWGQPGASLLPGPGDEPVGKHRAAGCDVPVASGSLTQGCFQQASRLSRAHSVALHVAQF